MILELGEEVSRSDFFFIFSFPLFLGLEGEDVLKSPIFSGDIKILCRAYRVESEKVVLQTRLDADDGLHNEYIEKLQERAVENFGMNEIHSVTPSWLYWCSRRHFQWYSEESVKYGVVEYIVHEKLCVTPGITG